jgi:hypothetical protein
MGRGRLASAIPPVAVGLIIGLIMLLWIAALGWVAEAVLSWIAHLLF